MAFRALALLFTAASLLPLWACRFPALQDYPQHLLTAHILATLGDGTTGYDGLYEGKLRPGPYSAFALLTVTLHRAFPIETAGRISLSAFPILILALVLALRRRLAAGTAPTGLLLLFPLALQQIWFLGFVDFLFATPVALLALLVHRDIARDGAAPMRLVRILCLEIALFFTHPAGAALFGGLALLQALGTRGRRMPLAILALLPLVAIAAWALLIPGDASRPSLSGGLRPRWLPPLETLGFLVCPANGLDLRGGPHVASLAATGLVLGGAALALRGRSIGDRSLRRATALALLLTLVAIFALPFSFGDYHYLNLRYAAAAGLLAATVIGTLGAPRRSASVLLAAGAAFLLGLAVVRQFRISAETADILPLSAALPKRAAVLPLVFDPDSTELDAAFFDPHLHDAAWLTIRAGGGLFPYVFETPAIPVRLRSHVRPPAPGEYDPDRFLYAVHGAPFSHFALRGAAPRAVAAEIEARTIFAADSGPWTLWRNLRLPR